jgi:hypothetical protein
VPDQFKIAKTLNLLGYRNPYATLPIKPVVVMAPPATDGPIVQDEEP